MPLRQKLRGVTRGFFKLLDSTDFFRYGFMENKMIWMHMLVGAILGIVLNLFFSKLVTIVLVFLIAILWEVYERYTETPTDEERVELYGPLEKRYWYDTMGDVIGVTVMAVLVMI